MLDWDKLRIFYAVAQASSFTRAGEHLNVSQSAVSRQISALEHSLQVSLFHRHARGLVLTEQGEILLRTVQEVFAKLARAETALADTKERPRGQLRVTVPVTFGASWLAPQVDEFLEMYPDIALSIIVDDRELDLNMREADAAVRFHQSRQTDLIQRHLFTMTNGLYAAHTYLRRHGVPQTPEELDQHRLIVYGDAARPPHEDINWVLRLGATPANPREPVLKINNIFGIMKAVKAGVGIAALPDFLMRNQKRVIRLLESHEGPKVDAYFVYPAEMRNSKRIKVFRDFLLRRIGEARL